MLIVKSRLWSINNATISQRYSSSDALAPTKILMLHTTVYRPSDSHIASCHPTHAHVPYFQSPQTCIHARYLINREIGHYLIIHGTGLLDVLANCKVSSSYLSYNTFETRCFLFYLVIAFVPSIILSLPHSWHDK